MRTLTKDTTNKIGREVTLMGWVHSRRDHGKLIFIDLRDRTGLAQVVINPKVSEASYAQAQTLRNEFVVEITGVVNKRPENLINPKLPTGEIEIEARSVFVFTEADTPPIEVTSDGYVIGEENRLMYKYLDMRRPRMQRNLRMRHRANQFFRTYLSNEGFVEIETPFLSKSTPEGARDYVVPSRLHPGNFYALPQSPQQYKQLLMVGGLEKYFQIVRCFRDEDTRGDRQPEFTQLDMELSFHDQEQILQLIESMITKLVSEHWPEKKIKETPWPRLTHKEAISRHQSDRPDLRSNKKDTQELAFAWVLSFPMFEKKDDGSLGTAHHPFTLPKFPPNHPNFSDDPYDYNHSRPAGEALRETLERKDEQELLALEAFQYDLVCNGYEVGGGSLRTYEPKTLELVFEALGHPNKEVQEKFGHLLRAFTYGVPPHGGIALGLDRLMAILLNEPNIREVIAFPKTGDGRDLMMNAPSEVTKKQLDELHIQIKK